MKHTLLTIASLFFLVLSSNAQTTFTGDTWAEAQENGEAEITAVYLEEDSFAYTVDGELTGVEIDIFEQFATWLKNSKGVDLSINYVKETGFNTFYNMVEESSGGVFGLGSVTILERRREEVQFSEPFINNIAVLVTHESAPDLGSMEEISRVYDDMVGIAPVGTTLEGYMEDLKAQYYPNLTINRINSHQDVLKNIIANPKSFAYMDLSMFWPAYKKQGEPIKRQAVGDLSAEQFGFIMPLDSDWSGVIDEFFSIGGGYRSTSAYRSILMKNLGTEVLQMLDLAQKRQNRR